MPFVGRGKPVKVFAGGVGRIISENMMDDRAYIRQFPLCIRGEDDIADPFDKGTMFLFRFPDKIVCLPAVP